METREIIELKKNDDTDLSRVFFLDQISKYKAILVGETGFINPNVNSEVKKKLKAIENYFRAHNSGATQWVNDNGKVVFGGIKTDTTFSAYLEFYILPRASQLVRPHPPPYYDVLFKQIHKYLYDIEFEGTPLPNAFAATMYNDGDDGDYSMVSADLDYEMSAAQEVAKFAPLPQVSMKASIDFIKKQAQETCNTPRNTTGFGVYLTLAGYEIDTYSNFLAAESAARFDFQTLLTATTKYFMTLKILQEFPHSTGTASLSSHPSEPDVELAPLPVHEVIQRLPEEAQKWRQPTTPVSPSLTARVPPPSPTPPPPSPPPSTNTRPMPTIRFMKDEHGNVNSYALKDKGPVIQRVNSAASSVTSGSKRKIQTVGKHVQGFEADKSGRRRATLVSARPSNVQTNRSANVSRYDQLESSVTSGQLARMNIPLQNQIDWTRIDRTVQSSGKPVQFRRPVYQRSVTPLGSIASHYSRTSSHPIRAKQPWAQHVVGPPVERISIANSSTPTISFNGKLANFHIHQQYPRRPLRRTKLSIDIANGTYPLGKQNTAHWQDTHKTRIMHGQRVPPDTSHSIIPTSLSRRRQQTTDHQSMESLGSHASAMHVDRQSLNNGVYMFAQLPIPSRMQPNTSVRKPKHAPAKIYQRGRASALTIVENQNAPPAATKQTKHTYKKLSNRPLPHLQTKL